MHATSSSSTPRGAPSRRGRSPRNASGSPSPSTVPTSDEDKPLPTFTSSLDILVEGTVPIESDPPGHSGPSQLSHAPPQVATSGSKRAPRKSKTEALAALSSHARSSSVGGESSGYQDDAAAISRNGPPIRVSPALDLSSVKTADQRSVASTTQPRPFGLEDCPTFYPSPDEFKDPMGYISSISEQAQAYGICKIVPPKEWKMPFVTDTENFRFKTRLQRLNSIEASSRAKLNFLEALYKFHNQQGNPRVSIPTINHKPLDLWLLRKEVANLGGFDQVTQDKKWSDLGRLLGYRGIPGLSTQIKNSYTRVILPYEHFCERAPRNSPSSSPGGRDPSPSKAPLSTSSVKKTPRLSSSALNADDTSPPSSPLTATSSPLSEPPDDGDYKESNGSKSDHSRPRRSTRTSTHDHTASTSKKPLSSTLLPLPVIPSPVFYDKPDANTKGTPEQNCEICHKKNRGEEMLLCDGCDCGFHMFCLDPPLDSIPKEQWFCYTCISGTGGDFGFDEGEEHSLSTFQARDLEFRRRWFASHPPPQPPADAAEVDDPMVNRIGDVFVSEYNLEQEFWRLVHSPHETVEIEYGADVHSTTHGSAMPTMETHPLNPYSRDPWNLNNIPIVSDSLLRFIKSDISGMTVPWTYVGMTFSTFCWHNEDHYTYSVNYMHWGETKTWYGIPGEDAEKFEAAIKSEAPDLFEAQPDLLFQLVTLMNPEGLSKAGVRVYACNQRAGEFVITFPKAYHAGFNHGLNFNEAVNFALPNWLPFGKDCVQRYREHRKLPVFSHDELLITITQQAQSIRTAMWLVKSLKEMTDREMRDRKRARQLGLAEVTEEEDRPEDQYQCMVCKAFCYLSQVTCQCSTKVVCVDHAELLCDRPMHHLTLRKRFSDEDLLEIQNKVEERAGIPSAWRTKLNKLLLESARPPLRSLRALLAEGDRINYHLPELANLRKCVVRANEWVDAANTFIIRKQSRKRSRRSRGRPSQGEALATADDPGERPDKGLDDLHALIGEVDKLGVDCPEIGVLRTLQQEAREIKEKARVLLESADSAADREEFVQECERLLLHGSSINVQLDELQTVEKIVLREQLIKELDERSDDSALTLEEVRQLLTRARACDLPDNDPRLETLRGRHRRGGNWEDRANHILAQPFKTIADLDDFFDVDASVPIDPAILDRLRAARTKAMEYDKQARIWLDGVQPRPKVQDALKLVARASKDFKIANIDSLRDVASIAQDLETRCELVLRNRHTRGDRSVFSEIDEWTAYAKQHLEIFALPMFEKLNTQLDRHKQWLQELPWNERQGQEILNDVIESTRPEDDLPPTDEYFTCICTDAVRPPAPGAISDAVQCDHCFARFHGECARNGGSCPFCDHHHWNGELHKERSWHFCYLPGLLIQAPEITKNYSREWKELEIIVHRLDRLSAVIGQFLSFASQPGNQRVEYIHQVRHYMRKLYKIQFAVSPSVDVSFGLDLAGLHRILAGQPVAVRTKKRRRPRFIFGQDDDEDWSDGTRCICRGRTPYLLNYPTVQCELCNKLYHAGCVFFPLDQTNKSNNHFMCPLCCLRKNRPYQHSEVRVKPLVEESGGLGPDVYVNTKEMLDTFSKELIYKKLPHPYTATLFVELIRFVPGQPDNIPMNNCHTNSHVARAIAAPMSHHPMMPAPHMAHHDHAPPAPMSGSMSMFSATPAEQPGGPPAAESPWSRWGTMTTPSRPPSTQRRAPLAEASRRSTPQPSRKRKHPEGPQRAEEVPGSASKRRAPQTPVTLPPVTLPPVALPPPPPPPARPIQTLSPSLAMIVSPTDTDVSPRMLASPRYSVPNGAMRSTHSVTADDATSKEFDS